MAFRLSESEFAGVDLASKPIAKARAMTKELGLANIAFHQLDLLAVPLDLGDFDFIIAHGVYSWVPPDVRDKILAICRTHLRPQGIAYISYNTYPGWHLRRAVREMMLIHIKNIPDPQQRINQARALAKWLTDSQTKSNAYATLLKERYESLSARDDGGIYHDDLSAVNDPVYFYQFIEHAARHELKYVAEADFFEMQGYNYPPEATQLLDAMAARDIHMKEQYLDFLKGRSFRQTLLCHREVELNRPPKAEDMRLFYVASAAGPESPTPDLKSQAVEKFVGANDSAVSTAHPIAKAALFHLSTIWPRSISFGELLAKSRAILERDAAEESTDLTEDETVLSEVISGTFAAGLTELHVVPSRYVLEVSERPVASPLARAQLLRGNIVTTLRLQRMEIEGELAKQLLLLLDGTRDREALQRELMVVLESGRASLVRDGETVSDLEEIRRILPAELEDNLKALARFALLVA